MGGLSKNQKKIMELLQIKPDMTTKEIAELILGRIASYKSKEYGSVYRSLISPERQGCIQKVHVQLRWRLATEKKNEETPLKS
jgi:ribosomal protein L35AE/L33A